MPAVSRVVCLTFAVAGAAAYAQGKTDCRIAAAGRVSSEIECRVAPSSVAQRVRFSARFSGSHDDTRASLAAALDGAPVACEEGSKTTTEAEDGDVTLDCRLTVAGKPSATQVMQVKLRWYHAEYADFDFKTD